MKFSLIPLSALFLSMTFGAAQCSNVSETVIVSTDLGQIRGVTLNSRLGEKFFAFRGIRYGKAPIGDLRFRAPEPVPSWAPEVLDATEDGPMCPQYFVDAANYSEDCLMLNVYSRDLNENARKPVIFYLHAGGFYSLSGQSNFVAGPQLFMDQDVVLVAINYRLGSLGFLATGTRDAPGNAGLKDQVMALRWVKEHIKKFGGDPDNVTLLGYSAGAMSAVLHMVSPMSKGLFHRVIAMSGSSTAQWDYPRDQLEVAVKQAQLLRCPIDDFDKMIHCLKEKSAEDYANTMADMFEFGTNNPIILWSPVLERDLGQERFIVENPNKSFKEGNFHRVPLIAGITKDEFLKPAIEVLQSESLTAKMQGDFETVAPICFLYERNTERSVKISEELQKAYLNDTTLSLSNNSIDTLGQLFSDGVIGFGVHRLVNLASKFTKVYYYRFAYKGRFSHVTYPGNEPYGVVHHDDLLYLFAVPGFTPLFTENDPEHKIVQRSTKMWAEFATKGSPNVNDKVVGKIEWERFTPENQLYMDIGEEMEMKTELYTDRYKIWEGLFPL